MRKSGKKSMNIKPINMVMGFAMVCMSFEALAVISDPGTRRAPQRSSNVVVTPGTTVTPAVTSVAATTQTCSDGNKVPLKLLQMITENGKGIEISGFDIGANPKTVVVKIPEHVSACTNFTVNVLQSPDTSNIAVTIENTFNFETHYQENGWELPSNFSRMSTNEKYEDCLKKEGILVNGRLERPEYKEQNYATTISAPASLSHFSPTKPMNVFFGSPQFLGREYGPAHRIQENQLVGDQCLSLEDIGANDEGVLYSKKEAETARMVEVCQSGDRDAIRAVLNSLGNAPELRKVMEAALDRASDKRALEIYERLAAIEERFKPSADDRAAGRSTGLTERQARNLGREYGDLLKELDGLVMTPAINRITSLLEERNQTATSEARTDAIDAEIKELNDKIGRIHKRSAQMNVVYNGLRQYALGDEGRRIEGFRLKSDAFSRVYEGRGDSKRGSRLTIEGANAHIVKHLRQFENQVMRNWDDSYMASQGDRTPVRNAEREMQRRYGTLQNEYQRYMKNEQEEYQRYCEAGFFGVKNPARCQRWHQGQASRQKRYLRTRERRLKEVQAQSGRLQSLTGQYEAAQRRIASEASEYSSDPLGFYDNFDTGNFYSELGGLGGGFYDSYGGGQDNFGMMTNMMPPNMNMMAPGGFMPNMGGSPQQMMPLGAGATMLTNPLHQQMPMAPVQRFGY